MFLKGFVQGFQRIPSSDPEKSGVKNIAWKDENGSETIKFGLTRVMTKKEQVNHHVARHLDYDC